MQNDVVESRLDHELFFFQCTDCGYSPRDLSVGTIPEGQAILDCPRCLFPNDLSAAPNSAELATARRTAYEKDNRARAAGKIVKRRGGKTS